jgi:hypothetical protein
MHNMHEYFEVAKIVMVQVIDSIEKCFNDLNFIKWKLHKWLIIQKAHSIFLHIGKFSILWGNYYVEGHELNAFYGWPKMINEEFFW